MSVSNPFSHRNMVSVIGLSLGSLDVRKVSRRIVTRSLYSWTTHIGGRYSLYPFRLQKEGRVPWPAGPRVTARGDTEFHYRTGWDMCPAGWLTGCCAFLFSWEKRRGGSSFSSEHPNAAGEQEIKGRNCQLGRRRISGNWTSSPLL